MPSHQRPLTLTTVEVMARMCYYTPLIYVDAIIIIYHDLKVGLVNLCRKK